MRPLDSAAERRLSRRLLAIAGALFAFFVLDTLLALLPPAPPDIAIVQAVQALSWQPLTPLFGLVDWLEGLRQAILAVLVVAAVVVLNRAALRTGVACFLSGGVYWLLQELVRRPRPSAQLVHVVRHTATFSYPSGHEVFITWAASLVVVALLAPRLPRLLPLAWTAAGLLMLFVAVSRLWEGEHWPTDVVGGFLLGGAWFAAALGYLPLGRGLLRQLGAAR